MVENLHEIIYLFYEAIGMKINLEKSLLILWELSDLERIGISQIFPFLLRDFEAGLKYLGIPSESKPVQEISLDMAPGKVGKKK